MGKKRTKTRITCKIDELPEEIKRNVDILLIDTGNTYQYISDWLKEMGYEVSKSSVGRYALRSNTAEQRLLEASAQTQKLIKMVQDNPNADYTDAANIMLLDGLVNKMATAEEEFNDMPLDKAGRLIVSLTRTQVYKDRVKQDMQKKADIAFKELEESIMKTIKQDPEMAAQIGACLKKAKERMIQDD